MNGAINHILIAQFETSVLIPRDFFFLCISHVYTCTVNIWRHELVTTTGGIGTNEENKYIVERCTFSQGPIEIGVGDIDNGLYMY